MSASSDSNNSGEPTGVNVGILAADEFTHVLGDRRGAAKAASMNHR